MSKTFKYLYLVQQKNRCKRYIPYLVIQQNTKYGNHHPSNIDNRHRISQRNERHGDDSNALGAVGDGVAEWRDQSNYGERDNVLCKVAEAVDQQQRYETWGVRTVSLQATHNKNQKYASYPDWHVSPHVDQPRLHSQWWLTRHSIVAGQFVTSGSRLCNALSPWGLTPRPKFTKIADDLLPTQVYHPAKFHHPALTHAGDIAYKISADKRTKKETVKPACPSACGITTHCVTSPM